MTVAMSLVLAGVVWAISMIRSVGVQALVYSLPIPVSLVLVSTGATVDGSQVVGVAALVLFFLQISWLHAHWRWNILVADVAAAATYVAIGAVSSRLPNLPFWPAAGLYLGCWLLVVRRLGCGPVPAVSGGETPRRRDPLPVFVRPFVAFAGALPMVWLGTLLQGMVVTFPYSGVLVVVEARSRIWEFSRQFIRNSISLLFFLAGYQLLQDISTPVALVGGWSAFGACALLVNARRLGPRRRPAPG